MQPKIVASQNVTLMELDQLKGALFGTLNVICSDFSLSPLTSPVCKINIIKLIFV